MARGRRLRKSAGEELKMNKENGTTSDDENLVPNVVVSGTTILLPNVVMSDEANAKQHVAATIEQNMAITNETIDNQNSVASD
jgi:hypothetical protein